MNTQNKNNNDFIIEIDVSEEPITETLTAENTVTIDFDDLFLNDVDIFELDETTVDMAELEDDFHEESEGHNTVDHQELDSLHDIDLEFNDTLE